MSERRRGPWLIHSDRVVYDTKWMHVTEYEITQPDGQPGHYGVMSHKNWAIGVVPVFENGDVMLVGQFRFAMDAYSWELPEGGGPKDASPLDSAQRELKEETGLSAQNWQEILGLDLSNSITDEKAFAFLAWGLTEGEAEPEGTEDITTKRVPFQTALKMAMMGEIRDAFTLAMLAKVDYMARQGALPGALAKAVLAPADETVKV